MTMKNYYRLIVILFVSLSQLWGNQDQKNTADHSVSDQNISKQIQAEDVREYEKQIMTETIDSMVSRYQNAPSKEEAQKIMKQIKQEISRINQEILNREISDYQNAEKENSRTYK